MKREKKKGFVRVRADTGQHRRILWTGLVLGMLAFVPVAVRLYDLMVVNYEYYSDLALRNQTRSTTITANRGYIYDRNMDILACAQSAENLYLDPHELRQSSANLDEIAEFLGNTLDLDPAWIVEQGKKMAMRYTKIGADLDEETATIIRNYINENKISGIHLEPTSVRFYPNGALAAHVIGFTNASNTGSEGIEASYNSYLAGNAGSVITTKGNNELDMPFSYEDYIASNEGCSVILTLDTTVQECLEKRMEEAISAYAVQNGAFGMVMNVNTGEILAMATKGDYDPNNYLEIADQKTLESLEEMQAQYLSQPVESEAYTTGKAKYQSALTAAQLLQWRNRCISDGYEPGSTFKVLTLAAALDCGAVDLDTSFSCGGSEQIPGRAQLLHCWRSKGHGSQKTAQALQNSCNLAFAHIGLKIGGERFYNYIKAFGVTEKTGVDLLGESGGVFFSQELITDTDKWGTASLTSASFGQTFKITPIQLLRAISAVVNGGYLMEPYIVSEVIDAEGNTVLKQEPTQLRQVISEETSQIMCGLLESVVAEGTAKNASVAGYSIGGKTGTSEKIDVFDENGQRVQDKIVSFVGVAPMDDPEYIVLVALDTPSRATGIYISGGVMAAPTVGKVMEDILPYLGVKKNYSAEDKEGQTITMPDLTGMTDKQVADTLKEAGLEAVRRGEEDTVTGQIPAPGKSVPWGSQVMVYYGEPVDTETAIVPDFTGMNRQQANDAAVSAGLYISVTGNTDMQPNVVVIRQSLPAGSDVEKGSVIELQFADTKAVD